MKKEKIIGFTRSIESTQEVKETPFIKDDKYLIQFDSGRGIAFEDANTHTIVFGTTGSGKTSNFVTPALNAFIAYGQGGLVVDQKGNLTEQVMQMAIHLGREEDVVEFGSSETATPLNLLAGLNSMEVLETLKRITNQSYEGKTHSLDFHMRGLAQASSLISLCSFIAVRFKEFTPTLSLLIQLLNNPELASEIFTLFLNHIYDANNKEEKEVVKFIEASEFHICHYKARKIAARSNSRESEYFRQVTYELGSVRTGLFEYTECPGILAGFSAYDGAGLNMEEMIKQNKIVILRFGVASGAVGAGLARHLLEEQYKAIYKLGTEHATKHPSFICLDEFQDIVDLSGRKYSDMSFISQAREFKVSFLASTQSASALASREFTNKQVDAFISNCNNKIIFYSDDPATQSLVDRHNKGVFLTELPAGQAFVDQYVVKTRKHLQNLERLQGEYETMQTFFLENPPVKTIREKEFIEIEGSFLLSLLENTFSNKLNTDTHENTKTEKDVEQDKNIKQETSVNKETKQEVLTNKDTVKGENMEGKQKQSKIFASTIQASFPEFFDEGIEEIAIPKGWVNSLMDALALFKETEMSVQIQSFSTHNGVLKVQTNNRRRPFAGDSIADSLLNDFLRTTEKTCVLCGTQDIEYNYKKSPTSFPYCQACLKKFPVLMQKKQKKEEYHAEEKCVDNIF